MKISCFLATVSLPLSVCRSAEQFVSVTKVSFHCYVLQIGSMFTEVDTQTHSHRERTEGQRREREKEREREREREYGLS